MLLKLLERLDRDRFSPMVISLTGNGEIGARIKALGIPTYVLGIRPAFPNILLFFQLIKLIHQFKPDIVHTWMYHADLLGGLAARIASNQLVVWSIRQSNLSKDGNKCTTLTVLQFCALLSRWLPSHILSCSERARDVHAAIGYAAHKMSVIPNGFDLHRFAPDSSARIAVRQELDLDVQTPLIGLIGRFDPQKNHLGFVKAAQTVHQQRPDVHFLLAGTGIERSNQELWTAIEQAGLSRHFHLLGRRDDVPILMSSLDLLASSSDGEAFPNVLGEAMACGVSCVVTDVGDSRDIVGDTGRVVAAGDMAGLASQLLEVLALPPEEKRRLGQAARQRVAERYEIGKIVRQYQEFYQSMFEVIK